MVEFKYLLLLLEPKCCVLELFGRMFELKMLETSQTSETHKKGIES
jgi:hypothetical protein